MGEAGTASNQKAVEAVEALLKARGDVRDATSLRLDGLDKDVIDLRANIDKNLSKDDAVAAKRGLRMKSAVVRRTISELNASTIDTLAATKGRIDAQLVEFEAAIADMKKRVAWSRRRRPTAACAQCTCSPTSVHATPPRLSRTTAHRS